MIPTKTLRELTIEGINTVLTSLEGNDKKGNPILNITKMQKKIDDSGRWVSVDVLRQKLRQILDDFGDLEDYENDDVIELYKALKQFLVELEQKEAKPE